MTTQVGQQIPEFFSYMALFVEQTTRNLRQGLTFSDNFDAQILTVSLKHGTAQVVRTSKSPVQMVIPVRLTSTTQVISGFNWYYDTDGNFTVCVQLSAQADPTSHPSAAVPVTLVIFF